MDGVDNTYRVVTERVVERAALPVAAGDAAGGEGGSAGSKYDVSAAMAMAAARRLLDARIAEWPDDSHWIEPGDAPFAAPGA